MNKRCLLFVLACAGLAVALNLPLAIQGVSVNWSDFSATLLSRIAVGKEFLDYGWSDRYALMLSGIGAAGNGLDPKLDTLLFATLNPLSATFAFYLVRDFALLAGLAAVLILHYRVAPPIALAAAALACQGFNVLNWFFYRDDYFGPAFLFGYQFLPLLVLPALLLRESTSSRRLLYCFLASFAAALLYSVSTVYALSVFTAPLAAVWIALMVRSKAAMWSILGLLLGIGLAAGPQIWSFLHDTGSIRHVSWEVEQIMPLRDTLWLLSHRDFDMTMLALLLVAAAAVLAVKGGRREAVLGLGLLYGLAMLPDPVMKSVIAQFSFVPPLLKSVNYYSYITAPIFFCGALAVGFATVPRAATCYLSAALLGLAGYLSWTKVASENDRPGMWLADVLADPALADVSRLTGSASQRAAMLTTNVASLQHFQFGLPRPTPFYLNVNQIPTSDGYASNLSYKYALLWSTILTPKEAPALSAPGLMRAAYLQVDVHDVIAKTPEGCLQQTGPLPLATINLDLLQLTATRYIASPYDIDDGRLRLVRARTPGPIVCKDRRMRGGFNVYEITGAPKRASIARKVEVAGGEQDVLERMRRSAPEDADTGWISASAAEGLPAESLTGATGTVDVLVDRPDRLWVRTRSSAPALLIVRDRSSGKARVTVNGAAAQTVPANYVYFAVAIPAGESRVDISY